MTRYIVKQKDADVFVRSHEIITVVSNDYLKSENELHKFTFTKTPERKLAKRFDNFSIAESIRRECNASNNIGIKWVVELDNGKDKG